MNKWETDWLDKLSEAFYEKDELELVCIVNKIYRDGYVDGIAEVEERDCVPEPPEYNDLD